MSSRNYALQGEQREKAGKGVARALRREKKVPAVIYGDGKQPVSVSLPAKEINLEYLKGHMFTSLCNLSVGGQEHLVLARDIQTHPVSDNVMHVDFLRVTSKTKLEVHVPVKFINEEECEGIQKDGGVLNIVLHDLLLLCQATEIPDHIDIDLSQFGLHDAIHISNIKLPKGVEPASDRDETIATIAEPRRIVEETPEAEAAEGAEGAAAAEGAEKAEGEAKEE